MLSFCLHKRMEAHQRIKYTIITKKVLVCVVHLFGNMENTITIWGYSGKYLFLCLKHSKPDGMLCHVFGINVGSFCLFQLSCLASLLRRCKALNHTHFSCITSPSYLFYHQVSDLHWLFLERSQTSVAASDRGLFSFEQADPIQFVLSASTPTVVVTAAAAFINFNLKADSHWLAVACRCEMRIYVFHMVDVSGKSVDYLVGLFDALIV